LTTHIFIVNETSFPVHLNYLFAGTGAGEKDSHIGLLADICRIRVGDQIIFYLEGVGFFGIFEAAGLAFKDIGNPTYLQSDLGKKLIYRIRLRPATVYPCYISEWKALDKLPLYAKDVIWSLIYRKLKGNRGCTPITIQESRRLIELLKAENQGETIIRLNNNEALAYDLATKRIIKTSAVYNYLGSFNNTENVLRMMISKDKSNHAYEIELQSYFTKYIGTLKKLEPITGSNNHLIWFGNEVSCGVGMQKIDIFSITSEERENKVFNLVELKCIPAYSNIALQLERYVIWTESFIEGAINSNIQPIVVSRKIINGYHKRTGAPLKGLKERKNAINSFKEFNNLNISRKINWFEFDFINNDITFEKVEYDI